MSPQYLRSRYQMGRDKKSIKYLGISLTVDLSKLEDLTMALLKKIQQTLTGGI